jgi:hypothetical protein
MWSDLGAPGYSGSMGVAAITATDAEGNDVTALHLA